MDLSIKDDQFNIDNLELKVCKNCIKILYDVSTIQLIGITFTLQDFQIIEKNDNIIKLKINNSTVLENIKKIDNKLHKEYNNYTKMIDDENIYIKTFTNINLKENILFNINSLKKIGDKLKVQIFTI